MLLRKKQNKGADRNKPQEQTAKIKAFPGTYGFSSSGTDAPSAPAVRDSGTAPVPAPAADPATVPAESVQDMNWSRTGSERFKLQDTIWTEDRYEIRFVYRDGRQLQSVEVSRGETPVYSGDTPVKADDERCTYTFAGWSPEIAPASSDMTYTAMFSAEVRPLPEPEPEDEPAEKDEPVEEDEPAETDGPVEEDDAASFYLPDESDDDPDSFYRPDESEYEPEPASRYEAETDPGDGEVYAAEAEDGEDYGFTFPEDDEAGEEAEPESVSGDGPAEESALPDGSGEDAPSMPAGSLMPRLESKGKTSLVAIWQPVAGVDGYDVFFAPSGTGLGDPYTTVSSEETAVTFGHLEKKTAYKTRIRAFVRSRGQKTYVCDSLTLHSITGNSTKKFTNAQEIVLKNEQLQLAVGEKKKISAEVIGCDAEKQVFARGSTLRYLTGRPDIAAVTKDGKVHGVAPGSCKIWLVALNGVHAVLEVTVKSAGLKAVTFKKKKYSVKVGKQIDLKKKLKSAPKKKRSSLKWKSSDRDIAEVNRKGIVTALKKGKATVRVKTADGVRNRVRIRVSPDKKHIEVPWESIGFSGSDKGRKL